MGMGAAAAHATVISWDNLLKLFAEQMQSLEAKLAKCEFSLGELAIILEDYSVGTSFDDEALNELVFAWRGFVDDFRRITNTNGTALEISLCHYDREAGDRYDEIEFDYYFAIEGVYQLTPAGERFRSVLEEKSWTVFC